MGFLHAARSYWAKRCPRCGDGRIYESGMKMNPRCPVCGLRFEREPGYFVGSMYISYAISFLFMGMVMLLGHLAFSEVDLSWIFLGAVACFLPFAPATTRYARIMWIYLDRLIWPARPGSDD